MIDPQLFATIQASPEYQKGQERYNELLVRSATDLEFRQRLLADPKAALAEFSGHELPEEVRNLDIRFVENHGDVTIVLPDPVRADHELSEEELESVAGGAVTTLTVLSTAACASAVISAAAVIGIYKLAQQ